MECGITYFESEHGHYLYVPGSKPEFVPIELDDLEWSAARLLNKAKAKLHQRKEEPIAFRLSPNASGLSELLEARGAHVFIDVA